MHCTLGVTAPLPLPQVNWGALRSSLAGLRLPLRNILFAACLSLAATMILRAEEVPQGWVPDVLELPADMEVLTDRSIGSSLRMFSFSTESDPEALLIKWEEALTAAGYVIVQAQDDTLDQAIEFSGQGIGNAKIVLSPTNAEGRVVIEFDATLQ
jgi:hypothetical protein